MAQPSAWGRTSLAIYGGADTSLAGFFSITPAKGLGVGTHNSTT